MKKFLFLIVLFGLLFEVTSYSQSNFLSGSNISGNFQFDGQTYKPDSLIGAENVPQEILTNTWFRLNYNYEGFYSVFRYEAYLDPILGYDPRLKGNGFAFRSFGYKNDFIDVVAGNFYGQFGSGLIFRSYEERLLGWDNPLDGARIKLTPTEGLDVTAMVGTMRAYWNQSKGLIRGGDINITTNDLFENLLPQDLVLTFGGSFMSRYQADNSSFLKLPENVFAWSARTALYHSIFSLTGEFAHKYNDSNATNKFSYNPGNALYVNAAVYPDNLGINLSYHRLDNMDFRADRDATGQTLQMNFIPPLSKLYTYRLLNMYPYATQFNGEVGTQIEITTSLLKKLFGDRKNADLVINFSRIQSIDTTQIDNFTYDSRWGMGDELFYQEFIFEFDKTWSRKFETKMLYSNQIYNKDVLENEGAAKNGKIYTNIAVIEAYIKLTRKKTLRLDFQHMWATQDSNFVHSDRRDGNWFVFLAEYSIAPHWYVSFMDDYNYNNPVEDYCLHYPMVSGTYAVKSTQISFLYGKQRGGLICVGGVCRPVPASNGFRLSVTTSF